MRFCDVRLPVAALGLLICGCAATGRLAREEANLPKAQVNARGLFLENCATCHGRDGRARTIHGRLLGAQNLTDRNWRQTTSTAAVIHAIQTGPGPMPAFGHKLSESEIEALAAYVRTLGGR
ncbi:MAG: c-type cytochrome [Verrucomicrobia bacterium]|nr:c-type cytochrome [Verrucomicrobiota bacterium]MDE3099354.1 c-type cytochrome [Verrucomicrobiota bacterium]